MRVNPDGTPVQDDTDNPQCLTCNTLPDEEERAPTWSPDGKRIVFMCRTGSALFELCTRKADGTDRKQVTNNNVGDLLGGRAWSPDGQRIVFHRGLGPPQFNELFLLSLNADGTPVQDSTENPNPWQLTNTDGFNLLASWGMLRVPGLALTVTPTPTRTPTVTTTPTPTNTPTMTPTLTPTAMPTP